MPRTSAPQATLGSLTQRGARAGMACRYCGSERVTQIGMALTDGSSVTFTSCHTCEQRSWQDQDSTAAAQIPVQSVLERAARRA